MWFNPVLDSNLRLQKHDVYLAKQENGTHTTI
jgi:hypothetical protein